MYIVISKSSLVMTYKTVGSYLDLYTSTIKFSQKNIKQSSQLFYAFIFIEIIMIQQMIIN